MLMLMLFKILPLLASQRLGWALARHVLTVLGSDLLMQAVGHGSLGAGLAGAALTGTGLGWSAANKALNPPKTSPQTNWHRLNG